MVVERLMVVSATETVSDTSQSDRILERLDRSIERVVLQRQDPISGLLPASTAHTVHGDYGDAWVRDCVYSIQCVWGLALAHRRRHGDPCSRAWELEQRVLALMRGLLRSMMRQAGKVERFKSSLDPGDALHAKYDSRTGEPVVADHAWGHLQLDATSLYLLQLAQLTRGGLTVIQSRDEADFIQNLIYYVARATGPATTASGNGATRATMACRNATPVPSAWRKPPWRPSKGWTCSANMVTEAVNCSSRREPSCG